MLESILVAGPWIGEFGYELFRWQGHLRALAEGYDRVIVASRPGHELLYKDFAEFIPFDTNPNPCEGPYNAADIDPTEYVHQVFAGIPYYQCVHPSTQYTDTDPAKYVPLGDYMPNTGYDLIFHARGIQVDKPEDMVKDHTQLKMSRNWPEENWHELVRQFHDHGFTMACIGDPRSAWALPYCDDKRGLPLNQLADLLRNSDWIMGPSSGPMHFASLCECRQFVWGTPNLRERYERLWNPFGTYVKLLECDTAWNPSVSDVICDFLFCQD